MVRPLELSFLFQYVPLPINIYLRNKMKQIFSLLIILVVSLNSQAGIIDISLNDTEFVVGEEINVTVTGEDLAPFDVINFFLVFDASLVDYLAPSLTTDLPDSRAGFEGDFLNLGLSFTYFGDAALDFGMDKFTLASFTLIAKTAGNLSIEVEELDALIPNTFRSLTLTGPTPVSANIVANSTPVNAPSLFSALFIAFGFLLYRSHRLQSK